MQFTKKDTALVKGVAILMMLFHHCFESAGRYAGYDMNFFPLNESQTITIASFFKICVALFVFLSGYGIAKSLEKTPQEGYTRQIGRRTFSLMSGYWFIFVLSIISSDNFVKDQLFDSLYFLTLSPITFNLSLYFIILFIKLLFPLFLFLLIL